MRFPFFLLALGFGAAVGAATPVDRIVVVINDGVVLQSELDRALQGGHQQLAERKIPEPPADVLRAQVLERLVLTRVQTERAQDAGIRVDDRELNEVIANIAANNKMSVTDFTEAVKKEGMDYMAFREQIRDEVLINRLRAREVENRVLVTEQDIDLFLANETHLDQT